MNAALIYVYKFCSFDFVVFVRRTAIVNANVTSFGFIIVNVIIIDGEIFIYLYISSADINIDKKKNLSSLSRGHFSVPYSIRYSEILFNLYVVFLQMAASSVEHYLNK